MDGEGGTRPTSNQTHLEPESAPPPPQPEMLILVPSEASTSSTVIAETDDGFVHFWEIFPRRNGKRLNKRLAMAAWSKLSIDDRRAAWRGARHYAAAVDAELQIAKDPDRFLKHRCWEDWQEPAVAPARGVGQRASTVERSWANIRNGPKEGIQ